MYMKYSESSEVSKFQNPTKGQFGNFNHELNSVGGWGLEAPTLAVITTNKSLSIGIISGHHVFSIPLQFFTCTKCDIAKVVGFGKPAGILEVAGCWSSHFASLNPLSMMSNGVGNERLWPLKVFEVFGREQEVLVVIRNQHSFIPNEKRATAPLWNFSFLPELRFLRPLIPVKLQ